MTMLSQQKIKDGSYVIEKERKREEKINAGYEKIAWYIGWQKIKNYNEQISISVGSLRISWV